MKKIMKQKNLLINYTKNLYKITKLIKTNMKYFVIILLNMLMKTKMNLLHKNVYKN